MERIKLLRKEKGMTQLQMQMKIGIDQSDYSKIERGIRYPTIDQLKSLAETFDTSIDYIVGLTDEKKPYPRKQENGKNMF